MSLGRIRSRAITLGGLMMFVLAVVLITAGTAEAKKKPKTEGLSQEEIKLLKNILPHIKYEESGVAGKPTIQFTGVNVQVVSGAGKTSAAVNGEGNLVIGYDEGIKTQTGSHNLIMGGEQEFTSYGGLLGGYSNKVSNPYASVTGGYGNWAFGELSSISGGLYNETIQNEDSVSGGGYNIASGVAGEKYSWVGGGYKNTADLEGSSIFGGYEVKVKSKFEGCGGSPTKLNC